MWFDKKEEKKPEKELSTVEKKDPLISGIDQTISELSMLNRDLQSIIRPISFELENAPDKIKAMNTNNFAADPFMLTTSNAKLVLGSFYDLVLKEVNSCDPQNYHIYPNCINTAHDVFSGFLVSEFFNIVSTRLCTRKLSKVSKALALYLLDKINSNRDTYDMICEIRNLITDYSIKYRMAREKNDDLTLTYYVEFNNALFMSLYAPTIDKISRTIDLDSKALMYMFDDDAIKEIYRILDDESLAYLKANTEQDIVIIKNCYKAIIAKDLDDLYMIFPEIVSNGSSILEKHCYDMGVKIKKLEDSIPKPEIFGSPNPFGDPDHIAKVLRINTRTDDD